MDPEDKIDISELPSENITWSGGGSSDSYNYDSAPPYEYNGKVTWTSSPGPTVFVDNIVSPANDNFNFVFDDLIDTSFDVKPMENEPAVYTSHEQREQHEKYPALQKIWEDYLAMFALTKGEPPIVD